MYSKPDDFCNGFFVAVFERNFDVSLPKCKYKGGNEYRNFINTNLNVKKNDMAEIAAYKRQKCGKKKKKKEDISTTVDEQNKISTNIVEFVIPKIESKNEVNTKTSEKEVKKMDVCSNLPNFNYKSALNESKDIQKKMSEEMKEKKSWKKTSKCKYTLQVEIDNDILKADYNKKIQNKKIETELSKIKKEKRKENKEIKINKIYFRKEKQDEETVSVTSKKRKRNKDNF